MKRDQRKTLLAGAFFLAALVLPLLGLGFGSWRWNMQTGLLMMVLIFAILFSVGVLLLWRVSDLSWPATSFPFLFGGLYTVLPDVFPLQVDDAAATSAGALFTFALALRKNPKTPKWVLLPLLAAGLYALLGGTFPGPIDELLVDIVVLLIAWRGARRAEMPSPELAQPEKKRGKVFMPAKKEEDAGDDDREPPQYVPPFVED